MGSLKEFPTMPFIRDANKQNNYDTVYQKKMTGRDCMKFLKFTNLKDKIISDEKTPDVDFNIIIQVIEIAGCETKKNIQLSFHTWLLKNINNNMYFIPNDPNFAVKSIFECGVFPLDAEIHNQKKNLQSLLDEYAQIITIDSNTLFLPYDSCNFSLNVAKQNIHVVVSVIKNVKMFVEENGKIHTKKLNNMAITLHILVNSNASGLTIDDILTHVSSIYKIKI